MTTSRHRRALVSVTNKSGLEELLPLAMSGFEFISTGGTADALRNLGIRVTDVSTITGRPALLSGRVQTLDFSVFAGLLADATVPEHDDQVFRHGIQPIDLLVVNFYDFTTDPSIGRIDIGGPAMVRAAAKNFNNVIVVVDPNDYWQVVDFLTNKKDPVIDPSDYRKYLAGKAFRMTADYDTAIADWMQGPQAPMPSLGGWPYGQS